MKMRLVTISNVITEGKQKRRYFKLPYIGYCSKITPRKLKSLTQRLCTDLDIKLVFSPYKIKNLLCFKDPISSELKSTVVYRFTCALCNSRSIGEIICRAVLRKYYRGGVSSLQPTDARACTDYILSIEAFVFRSSAY